MSSLAHKNNVHFQPPLKLDFQGRVMASSAPKNGGYFKIGYDAITNP